MKALKGMMIGNLVISILSRRPYSISILGIPTENFIGSAFKSPFQISLHMT
jgi:hypothetical protein